MTRRREHVESFGVKLDMVPLPNTTGANNFIRQPNVEDDSDRYLARVDVSPEGLRALARAKFVLLPLALSFVTFHQIGFIASISRPV